MMKKDSQSIIGGMFGLPVSIDSKPSTLLSDWRFLKESNLFMANARSGILILIDLLKPINLWMPSYLCPTMIDAVDKNKTKLKFYGVDYNLKIPSIDWIEQIQPEDIVLLIDYFGFPLPADIAKMVKSKNAYVLEDASQALLSKHVGQFSDFIIFSPKKFIGIPDGGILCSRCNVSIDNITLKPIPQSHWLKMLEASINRREFDQFGGEKRWFRLFQECERTNLPGYFAMSDLSRNLLFYAFDYTQIAERRINNYLLLSHKLENLGIFDSLQKDTVPLGFVIRHQKQPSIRQYLFKKHIYPPVHWLLEGFVPKKYKDSHLLANQIMTLPCDQRYRSKDMSVLISNLLKILKQEESNIPW